MNAFACSQIRACRCATRAVEWPHRRPRVCGAPALSRISASPAVTRSFFAPPLSSLFAACRTRGGGRGGLWGRFPEKGNTREAHRKHRAPSQFFFAVVCHGSYRCVRRAVSGSVSGVSCDRLGYASPCRSSDPLSFLRMTLHTALLANAPSSPHPLLVLPPSPAAHFSLPFST